jgi:hypothetical protein
MIDLEFFDSASSLGVVKATVHKTGKLGFSSGASKFMKLDHAKLFNVGLNKADKGDKNLYFVPTSEETGKTFKVIKAGDYYYIFIKNILMELRIDYKNENVIYDIEEIKNGDSNYYKLMRRIK